MHALSPSGRHELIDDPQRAEMVLLAGDFESYAEVRENTLLRRYPEKTFAYSEIDALVPYVRGVYGSAAKPRFFDLRRTQSNIYFSRYGSAHNPEIRYRPDEPKRWLFCFRGRSDCRVRADLLSHDFGRPDVQVQETESYIHWQHGALGEGNARKDYADLLAQSHFALCPRGMGFGSIRLFEVMEMGVPPVLLADRYALPPGPAWDSFLVQVPESDVPSLPRILEPLVPQSWRRGELARKAWEQFFAPPVVFDRMIEQILEIRRSSLVPERWFRIAWPVLDLHANLRRSAAGLRGARKS